VLSDKATHDKVTRLKSEDRSLRPRVTSERVFLVVIFAIVAFVMVGQLWRTGFTCDDDLFTATAWQRWGGGAHGWTAIRRASWRMAIDQGRFYQLLPYTLTQSVYQLRSFEAVNTIRMSAMLFVFMSFTVMLVSVTRSFEFAIYCSILYAGLIETTYMYNPFHALPLWFNIGIGIMFVAISAFHEGLTRERHWWMQAAVVLYFVSALFYEVFLFYGAIFFILAYLHLRATPQSQIQKLSGAIAKVWQFGLVVLLYLALYIGFDLLYPYASYKSKTLSLAGFRQVADTIVGFSISGLNFKSVVPQNFQWNAPALATAFLVLSVCFWGMRRLAFKMQGRRLLWIAVFATICMLLPNILFGFMDRYRNWLLTANNFYLGSFYSGSAEAVVIAALSLWVVRQAARIHLAGVVAAIIAVFLAVATYSNVTQAEFFYDVHRENRKIWDLVEASISLTGGPNEAAIIVAPQLTRMTQLTPSIYDYWSFYFTEKFQHPVRVIGKWSEFRLLPPEAKVGPIFAFECHDFPDLHAGFFAFGPLDVTAWEDEGLLDATSARVGVLGGNGELSVFEQTPAQPAGRVLHGAVRQFDVEDVVDLGGLSLKR
jgi:hypothetical protein